jgi:nucleoside-diphosphate-sugar epimerase
VTIKKKLIGITGATGSLGTYLKKYLEKQYILKEFDGDITNKEKVSNWIGMFKFDIIIHLAALVPINIVESQKFLAKEINYKGTKIIIEEIKKLKKKPWFFFSSTSHVYHYNKKKIHEKTKTKPITYYGKTKQMAENYLLGQSKYLKICIARIFSFVTPNQKECFFIPQMYNKINNTEENKILINNINHYRDFISIEDLCSAILTLIKLQYVGIINICSAKKISLKKIISLLNFKKKLIYVKNNLESTKLIGNNAKLKKLGWKNKHSIQNVINKYIKEKNNF